MLPGMASTTVVEVMVRVQSPGHAAALHRLGRSGDQRPGDGENPERTENELRENRRISETATEEDSPPVAASPLVEISSVVRETGLEPARPCGH
jgi:hypothetical protein